MLVDIVVFAWKINKSECEYLLTPVTKYEFLTYFIFFSKRGPI